MRVELVRLLNLYEGIAIGIRYGLYEEEIIKAVRRGNMIKTYNAFENYIIYHRNEGNNKAYIEYETLVKKWKKEDITLKPETPIGQG